MRTSTVLYSSVVLEFSYGLLCKSGFNLVGIVKQKEICFNGEDEYSCLGVYI